MTLKSLLLFNHHFKSLWHGCCKCLFPSDYWVKSPFWYTSRLAWIISEVNLLESCVMVADWLENILLSYILYSRSGWMELITILVCFLPYEQWLSRWILPVGFLKKILIVDGKVPSKNNWLSQLIIDVCF